MDCKFTPNLDTVSEEFGHWCTTHERPAPCRSGPAGDPEPEPDPCRYRAAAEGDVLRLQCVTHGQPEPCPHDPAGAPAPPKKRHREHVIREVPPWRALDPAAATTVECGRKIETCRTMVTREVVRERAAQVGAKKALESLCATCRDRARANPAWGRDPAAVVGRDTDSYEAGHDQLVLELRALAALAAAHPDQFRDLLAGQRAAPSLDEARLARHRATVPPCLVWFA